MSTDSVPVLLDADTLIYCTLQVHFLDSHLLFDNSSDFEGIMSAETVNSLLTILRVTIADSCTLSIAVIQTAI